MLISMLITSEQLLGELLKSAGLFVVATFVFDAIHFSLHVCLNSRYRWLRRLASPHEAHHAFFDRRLRYHDEVAVPNLVHHVTVLESADILVLAHGAKGNQAMQANCDSFLAIFDRFKSLTRHRQVPVEVWAVGSEIECHPALGDAGLRSYARSKRAFARAAATLMHDRDVLYRHVVPSAFRSRMGTGLMDGRTAAAIAVWLIRRGFRYVPVTYTGIAFLNFIPFVLRGLRARADGSRSQRLLTVSSVTGRSPQSPRKFENHLALTPYSRSSCDVS
jgi:hypothetical protein